MTTTTICTCGHVSRVHSVLESGDCRGCECHTFTPATDPDAATEAARSHQERVEHLWTALRRAVGYRNLYDAQIALDELLEVTR